MKYFLDSAKLDEIDLAYNTFGIDGVTTNPRHIQNSGKPFKVVLRDIAAWVAAHGLEGYETSPVSVEINPHLDKAADMIAEGRTISALSKNFVIKLPCTEQGLTASRKLEKEGIRTNVTLVFSPAQSLPVDEQLQARSNIGAVAGTVVGNTATDFAAVFVGGLV